MIVQQITKGIKISVKTKEEGFIQENEIDYYTFSYQITIENNSLDTVQLIKRHWEIFDALNYKEFVDGKGVVGETPILSPKDSYTYKSGTFLQSNIGAMCGFFTMENLTKKNNFKVTIPTFNLSTIASLN
jgi:ApaG protein